MLAPVSDHDDDDESSSSASAAEPRQGEETTQSHQNGDSASDTTDEKTAPESTTNVNNNNNNKEPKEDNDDDASSTKDKKEDAMHGDDDEADDDEESIAVEEEKVPNSAGDEEEKKKESSSKKKKKKKKKKKEKDQEKKESKESSKDDDNKDEIIECPAIADVLVGRGQALKLHPGNQRMVAIIAVHRLRYQDANDEEKKDILEELTSEVSRGGTRFLKVNDNGTGWMKCTSQEVSAKILECVLLGKEDDSDPMVRAASAAAGNMAGIGGLAGVPGAAPGASSLGLAGLPGATSTGGLSGAADLSQLQNLANPATAANALLQSSTLPAGLTGAATATATPAPGATSTDLLLDSSKAATRLTGAEAQPKPEVSLSDLARNGMAGLVPGHASLLAQLDASRNSQVAVPTVAGGRINGPPLRTDVVIGKEALLYSQEGNLHLQSLVQANIGQEIIPTEMKRIKAKAIYERMVLGGARFLMKEVDGSGLWYQLSEVEAQNVVYRGLCEEEKRVQTLLISTLQAQSLGVGLPLGLNGANLGHLGHLGQLGLLSGLRQPGDESTLLQNAMANPLNPVMSSEPEQPKRKYKKRLRKLAEERRRSSNNMAFVKPSFNSLPAHGDGQDTSDASSEKSDNETKNVVLRGPIEIRPYDVILGRGRGSFNHPGNKNLIKIFRESKIPYGMGSKTEKIKMARNIVADIQSKGGRFLKRINDEKWEIISNKDAYKKVGHGIRDLREDEAISVDSEKSGSPESKKRKSDGSLDVSEVKSKHAKHEDGKKDSPSEMDAAEKNEAAEDSQEDKKEREPSSDEEDAESKDKAAEQPKASDDAPVDDTPRKEKARAAEDTPSKGTVGYQRSGFELPGAAGTRPEERTVYASPQHAAAPSFKGYGEGFQPRSIDVVCGRGKAFNRHPANRKMHEAVSRLKYQYRDATSQTEKSEIAHTVLRAIQDDGGKFLKFDETKREWEELLYKNALKKIYHSIRDSLYNDRSSFSNGEGESAIDQIVRRPSSSNKESRSLKAYERSRGEPNDPREAQMREAAQIRSQQGLAGDSRAGHYQMQQQHFMSNYPSHGTSQWAMNADPTYAARMRMGEYEAARGGAYDEARGMNPHQYPHQNHYPGQGRY